MPSCTSVPNFYPRPPRGRRLTASVSLLEYQRISIHALREEGDAAQRSGLKSLLNISIHALREEGDELRDAPAANAGISIHALREEGDLRTSQPTAAARSFLSTPSARKATFQLRGQAEGFFDFYPRPPRGRRRQLSSVPVALLLFLSTPSARKATCSVSGPAKQAKNFYPRPPRGRRLRCPRKRPRQRNFYPRPPRGRRQIRPC